MNTPTAPVIRLEDYQPPAFRIVDTALTVDLDFNETRISARHRVHRNTPSQPHLVLDMEALEIGEIAIDGNRLAAEQYRIEAGRLTLFDVPDGFDLAIKNTVRPAQNTALSGLYQSGEMLCTQCEAEGFRRITPAIDRPDNLGCYTVTLRADKQAFPVLLCNGNRIAHGDCSEGGCSEGDCGEKGHGEDRHYATWHDPFPKPTYLFAIVAGQLACLEDSFTTRSGRAVALAFFARRRDIDKCAHALASLKRAMAWDEQTYGREYDLELFNVVAVEDFNMGAMENKSLNIFNTQYLLADPVMASDGDFENVEAVVGHEYFHNWSGNRVTCRDWFQLSLKEGFTVFREQQFSADMGSKAVKRIADVAELRSYQFREDAGPMSHPVRPDSYIEINNFYTATVYNKGAEVIQMLHRLLGATAFRRGADLYFERHDGQAVTTDDFVAAMESAGGTDLTAFKRWYSQAGTPVVEVKTSHDAARGILEITLSQSCPPTPRQPRKKPFVIPVQTALFDRQGKRLSARAENNGDRRNNGNGGDTQDDLLVLSRRSQTFVYKGVAEPPVASLLRGFSAPVELRQALSEDDLGLLLSHDDDPFNRWEAGQKLFLRHLLKRVAEIRQGTQAPAVGDFDNIARAFASVLAETATDPALRAVILTPPDHAYIAEQLAAVDPAAIFHARRELKHHLAQTHRVKLLACYHQLNGCNDGAITAEQIARRSLRDTCLNYLIALDDPEIHDLAVALLQNARCMTDSATALGALANSSKPQRQALLDDFYRRWEHEPLVVDKWLRIQATVPAPQTLSRVEALSRHDAFDRTNPNKVYSLLVAFSHANPVCFHARDGSGYRFVSHWVAQLDPSNPQVSARLVSAFIHWKKYIPELQIQMRAALEEIATLPKLSADVAEIVGKSLQN